MIYFEDVRSGSALSFVSGDTLSEMIVFKNTAKAIGVLFAHSVTYTNIMMQYSDVKRVISMMESFTNIKSICVLTTCSWRISVENQYNTKLLEWRCIGDLH